MESTSNCPKRRSRFITGIAALTAAIIAAPAIAGGGCLGDLDGNGTVNSDDLGILLNNFGCEPVYDGPCAVPGPNGSGQPGCSADLACEAAVCAVDPFCCNTSWDSICADGAIELCEPTTFCLGDLDGNGTVNSDDLGILLNNFGCAPLNCGDPNAGSCCEANGTPFCNDAACCELICADDPFCCDTEWDGICANAAIDNCVSCFECGSAAAGSCCENNGTPYCDNAQCCETVCAVDPFCCNNTWDSLCAEGALELCGPLCVATGACCLGDGSCVEGPEQNCLNNGGTYQGDGTTCAEANCPQPLACGSADAGSCCEANGTPYCDNAQCCENNGTPYCDNAQCCEVVCAQDPFCCDTEWDNVCAGDAIELCGVVCNEPACGVLGTGSCCEANGTPFCNVALCCEVICAQDPFCCENEWDQVCADTALEICQACGAAPACGVIGTGSCCENNGTPFCNNADCCATVCALDAFCCDNTWDQICADQAATNCGTLCAP